ncbi:MAG: hypothetical protein AAF382_05680 [Pseudomonadota bacterium]
MRHAAFIAELPIERTSDGCRRICTEISWLEETRDCGRTIMISLFRSSNAFGKEDPTVRDTRLILDIAACRDLNALAAWDNSFPGVELKRDVQTLDLDL